MMKNARLKTVVSLGLLACLPTLFTGCTAARWRPSQMFSWSKKSPADSEFVQASQSEAPESPASKYTPGTIASVGSQTNAAGSKSPASAYGYTAPGATNPLGAGLAAKANGYQTGPYQVGAAGGSSTKPPATGGATATTGSIAATPETQNLRNPYGGNYKGVNTSDIALPNTLTNAIAEAKSSVDQISKTTYPNITLPSSTSSPNARGVGYPTSPRTNSVAPSGNTSNPGLPTYPSLPNSSSQGSTSKTPPASSAYTGRTTLGGNGNSNNTAGLSSTPSTTGNGLPALPNLPLPNGNSIGSSGAAPANTTTSPLGIGLPPSNLSTGTSSPAITGGATSGNPNTFRPGTTSRDTGYDFSSPNTTAAGNPSVPINPLLR